MLVALILLFLVLPFVELALFLTVGSQIGVLPTIVLLVLVGVVGAWLSKREGVGVLRRLNAALNEGTLPTNELIDGGLILFAGALMVTPGFVTDIVGVLLLLPPTRAAVRAVLVKRFKQRIEQSVVVGGTAGFARTFGDGFTSDSGFSGFSGRRGFGGDVVDTTATDTTRRPRTDPSPELR